MISLRFRIILSQPRIVEPAELLAVQWDLSATRLKCSQIQGANCMLLIVSIDILFSGTISPMDGLRHNLQIEDNEIKTVSHILCQKLKLMTVFKLIKE